MIFLWVKPSTPCFYKKHFLPSLLLLISEVLFPFPLNPFHATRSISLEKSRKPEVF